MKGLHRLLVLITACSSNYALASDQPTTPNFNLSVNVALASEYRWRGQTQTKNDAAFQGNFLLNHSSGFYVAAFASNVDFGDAAHLELDPFIGYTTPISLGNFRPTLDIGMLRYNYVGKSDLNYNEYYLKMIINNILSDSDIFSPSISYTDQYGGKATRQNIGQDVNNWYFNLLYTTPIAQTHFGAVASLGYSKASQAIYGGEVKDHFIDWKIGANYNYKPMNLVAELAAIGTDLGTTGYSETNKKGVKTAAVLSLTKSF
ncbi:TorF family putative porin [Acinetobacter sp. C26M]|uniref:TorF family putative porin n=1 Tax=unclassified Acinetobacter TaxID=196816 RepID=UPI0020369EFF|nr:MULTISPECIES: TorF family putative porin [unclassified Acinetobacter]USA45357.1 TorF family putative porin [Acinetobacter sp. C26M]USA48859.1 TorF family putative porin [Acinetobacter sp. C26G]